MLINDNKVYKLSLMITSDLIMETTPFPEMRKT